MYDEHQQDMQVLVTKLYRLTHFLRENGSLNREVKFIFLPKQIPLIGIISTVKFLQNGIMTHITPCSANPIAANTH